MLFSSCIMRKELKETTRAVVKNITMVMIPSVYFKRIIKLLHHFDKSVGKKALGLLYDSSRNHEKVSLMLKDKNASRSRSSFSWLHMDESSQESVNEMCLEILRVLDDSSNTSLKVAAVSVLEILAERFPSNSSIFGVCLGSITRCITSHNMAVTSSCLRTSVALINVLGPKALTILFLEKLESVMILSLPDKKEYLIN
ncbi:hypothetical protein TSUD_253930 [Trifolium subterraneum]|uniref:Clathrin/coatomer adaptor adaptin-like N-terminal domain-containing protein n=1 Tax=Trifolium subterraneum TaxID=3900 RepID=A0A2Z6P7C7_TRISU|nr:hypothetical protein TSUD_253930 [Trifolium subterraneum]